MIFDVLLAEQALFIHRSRICFLRRYGQNDYCHAA